jgi:hypothetical protein
MDSTGPDRARARDDLVTEAETWLSPRQRTAGAAGRGKRKRGRLKHVLRNAKTRERQVRVSQSRMTLASFLAAHQYAFPSEPRLIQAATGKPLQNERCQCDRCSGRRLQGWPVGYRWVFDASLSYECGLHRQSTQFLRSLPSSSSIVRFG